MNLHRVMQLRDTLLIKMSKGRAMLKACLTILLLIQVSLAVLVQGKIVDSTTGVGLQNVVVTLSNSTAVHRTNSAGEFSYDLPEQTVITQISEVVPYNLRFVPGRSLSITGGIGDVDFAVYNVQGRRVYARKLTSGQPSTAPLLNQGIYFYHLTTSDNVSLQGKVRLGGGITQHQLGRATGQVLVASQALAEPVEMNILSRTHHCRRVMIDSLIPSQQTISLNYDTTSELFNDTLIRSYYLDINQATLDDMEEYWAEEEYRPAFLSTDSANLGVIGVRYKGSHGLKICFDENNEKICPKVSIKFKFNEYQPGARHYGVK